MVFDILQYVSMIENCNFALSADMDHFNSFGKKSAEGLHIMLIGMQSPFFHKFR